MKKISTLLVTCFLGFYGNSQNLEWAQKYGVGGNDYCNAMVVDGFGSRYTTGWMSGAIDFDPSPTATAYLPSPSNSYFLQKTTATGDLSWVNGPQSGQTSGEAIDVNIAGEVYVCGFYYGTVDFDTTANVMSLTGTNAYPNIFVAKYSAGGTLLWVKGMECTGPFVVINNLAMKVHPMDGSISISGGFRGIFDSDPSASVATLSSPGSGFCAFLIHLDTDGIYDWSFAQVPTNPNQHTFANNHTEYAGNTLVVGTTYPLDYDPGAGTTTIPQSTNCLAGFLEKFDASGNLVWVKQIDAGINSAMTFRDASVDAFGNIYIAGDYYGTADFDPGAGVYSLTSVGYRPFVLKLDVNGNFVWVREVANQSTDQNFGYRVGINSDGNINFSGRFSGTADFDPLGGGHNLTSIGGFDAFLMEMTANGDFVWAGAVQSAADDLIRTMAFDVSPGGDLFIGGNLSGTMDVNPSPTVYNVTSVNSNADFYISKIACKSPIHQYEIACQSYTWATNGQTYTASGDYSESYTNQQGCDSIVSLHLTVGGPNAASQSMSQCFDPITSPSGNHVWTTTGIYNDTLTNFFGCDSVITVNVTITPIPDLTITQQDSVLTVAESGINYLWVDCNGGANLPAANQQSFQPTANGVYAVIINNGGCMDTSACFTVANLSYEDLNMPQLLVYPNPSFDGHFAVDFNGTIDAIELVDVFGRQVTAFIDPINGTIDASLLTSGNYFVRIVSNDAVYVRSVLLK